MKRTWQYLSMPILTGLLALGCTYEDKVREGDELEREITEDIDRTREELEQTGEAIDDAVQNSDYDTKDGLEDDLSRLDEEMDDFAARLEAMGENVSAEIKQAWANLKDERETVATEIRELGNAARDTTSDTLIHIEARLKKIGEGIDDLNQRVKTSVRS